MSETVHDAIARAAHDHEWSLSSKPEVWDEMGDTDRAYWYEAADAVLAVFREHGIKLCRADYEVHDLVPLTDEEIGQ